MKNFIKTKSDEKSLSSMGPWDIYRDLSLMTFYTPIYWRKVCRMLCNMRRMNHTDFKGDSFNRMVKYARGAYKDMKLPILVKISLRGCISREFNFDIDS